MVALRLHPSHHHLIPASHKTGVHNYAPVPLVIQGRFFELQISSFKLFKHLLLWL